MIILRDNTKDCYNELSTQQKAFVNSFLETVNPTESALKAGYKQSDAKRRAKELLSNPKIINTLNAKIDESAQSFVVHKCFFVKKLLEIIDSTTRQEDVLDRSGAPTGKKKLSDAGAALRALDALFRCIETERSAAASVQDTMKIMCIENLDDAKI